jgi:hypothetical protein
MPAPYDGGCICGAIRYRVDEEPLTLYACHCTDCQRHTGTSFALSMAVRRRTFEVVAGSPHEYAVTVDGGHVRHGRFCGACATRLWAEPARLRRSSCDRGRSTTDVVAPVAHICPNAQPWVSFGDDAVRFDAQPPDGRTLSSLRAQNAPTHDQAGGEYDSRTITSGFTRNAPSIALYGAIPKSG